MISEDYNSHITMIKIKAPHLASWLKSSKESSLFAYYYQVPQSGKETKELSRETLFSVTDILPWILQVALELFTAQL